MNAVVMWRITTRRMSGRLKGSRNFQLKCPELSNVVGEDRVKETAWTTLEEEREETRSRQFVNKFDEMLRDDLFSTAGTQGLREDRARSLFESLET